jgi:hypothetical protein
MAFLMSTFGGCIVPKIAKSVCHIFLYTVNPSPGDRDFFGWGRVYSS